MMHDAEAEKDDVGEMGVVVLVVVCTSTSSSVVATYMKALLW